MKCVVVGLKLNKGKKINYRMYIIYRIPGSNVDTFNDTLELLLHNVKSTNKSIYLCGNYNLDLMKHNAHTGTKNFLHIM